MSERASEGKREGEEISIVCVGQRDRERGRDGGSRCNMLCVAAARDSGVRGEMQEKQDSPAKASGGLGKVGQLASGKPTESPLSPVYGMHVSCSARA